MRWWVPSWARPTPPSPDLGEACRELDRVRSQRPEVESLAETLRVHRSMNGFAELVFKPRRRGGG